ncbi:hypothetical protein [Haloarcula argentinensis]|uniref:DUF8160 domain-containing protein n=1 Tax=Haloarcula argentinensis TaxID=43776 RepID=A0A830FM52_HALAR|nr:hypothetical protein [Haloarcula argentinensis]GGM50949.1 hypothetical protein GCM10009006_35140 [Haloarcula argentinensis]
MADKRDRDPFDQRYDEDSDDNNTQSNTSKTSEKSKTSETEETAKSQKSGKASENGGVRERRNVNMYLPDGLVDDLQLRYSELNVQWRRENGEDLPKNDEFYPAVIESSLRDTTIEKELGLADE